ncbi:11284_t:CDS:2 [Acaulospora colombiana]|uniref:11284_t:CDS:1 n=1 Tax=Acaulospora colombiana TaxID=27376 RepID=A0ACA9L4U6_9GLOM|nr:11284_t:CDS:2 [Acaulospora colombiana]
MSEFELEFDEQKIIDKGKGKEVLVDSPITNKAEIGEEMGEPPSGGETLGEYPESSDEEENDDDDDGVEGASSSTSNRYELSRKEEEFLEKDRSLLEFLLLLDNYEPLKFLADIATDAFQYCKIRQQSKKNVGKGIKYCPGTNYFFLELTNELQQRNKTVLTLEDLTAALSEYGVNIKKPDYYRA